MMTWLMKGLSAKAQGIRDIGRWGIRVGKKGKKEHYISYSLTTSSLSADGLDLITKELRLVIDS